MNTASGVCSRAQVRLRFLLGRNEVYAYQSYSRQGTDTVYGAWGLTDQPGRLVEFPFGRVGFWSELFGPPDVATVPSYGQAAYRTATRLEQVVVHEAPHAIGINHDAAATFANATVEACMALGHKIQ